MATDIERLVAVMEVNARKFERDMAKARRTVDDAMSDMDKRMRETNRSLQVGLDQVGSSASRLSNVLAPLAGVLAGVFSVQSARAAADTYIRTINALKVAGLEGRELERVYQDLFAVAQKQGVPVENLTRLYGQLSQAQGDLKVSSQDILRVVDATGASLRVSGVPAAQASGAILGLSQALSGGTVRAEEFNQMLEGGLRPALQAVANNIAEAGGSVGRLRQLVTEGEVSSRLFFAALQQGAPALDDLANRAGVTTAQAMTRLSNELVNFVGEADKATGASAKFAEIVDSIASAVRAGADAFPALIARLQEYSKAADAIIMQGPRLLQLLSLAQMAANPLAFQGVQDRINAAPPQGFDRGRFDLQGGGRQLPAAQADALRARVFNQQKPLSVNDARFRVEPKDTGGGGGGAAARISAYDREVEALNRRTAALQLDIDMFGKSAAAISKAKIEQELLNAVQRDGGTVTDEQRVKIGQLAQAYADTEANLKSLRDAQAASAELQRFIGTNLSSFFSDVVSGGKNAERALMNLVKRLADVALQAALLGDGPLAGIFGTRGTGGLIGTLFSAFGAAPGRSLGGPVRVGQAYTVGENGRETFVPTQSGRIINAAQMNRAGGSAQPVNLALNIDARGSTPDSVKLLEARIPAMVMSTMNEARRRGARFA